MGGAFPGADRSVAARREEFSFDGIDGKYWLPSTTTVASLSAMVFPAPRMPLPFLSTSPPKDNLQSGYRCAARLSKELDARATRIGFRNHLLGRKRVQRSQRNPRKPSLGKMRTAVCYNRARQGRNSNGRAESSNHGKVVPIFHFFAIPVFVANFIWSLFRLWHLGISFAESLE